MTVLPFKLIYLPNMIIKSKWIVYYFSNRLTTFTTALCLAMRLTAVRVMKVKKE